MTSLQELHYSHRGYVTDKWDGYFDFFELLLNPLRDQPVRLLEIGVQNGGSLQVWEEYFSGAEIIVGCDIDERCETIPYHNERMHVVIGDAADKAVAEEIRAFSPAFDIIVDDGSHVSQDIVQAFGHFLPMLAAGGRYIVEDLHCAFWDDWGGGLNRPLSVMDFFSRLVDAVNLESWGSRSELEKHLAPFFPGGLDDDLFQAVSAIERIIFGPSICGIVLGRDRAGVGLRVISGSEAPVNKKILGRGGRRLSDSRPKNVSYWDDPACLVAERDGLVAELGGVVAERDWWFGEFQRLRARRSVRFVLAAAALLRRFRGGRKAGSEAVKP